MTAANSHNGEATSLTMVQRAQERDPRAWEALCELYVPTVYGWSRQAGIQAGEAADIVQEVFQAVWTNIHRFQRQGENSSFRGWLWTITRNQVRLHFRRLALEPQAAGGSEAQQRIQQHADPLDEESELSRSASYQSLVNRALRLIQGDFEEKTWQAFWRMTVQGHSAAEIGDELGMNPRSVRQAKYRVLSRLRQELEGG